VVAIVLSNEKKIIDIVLRLFMEQGPKFKMEDVASEMKISKKTIYKDFGNKEDLVMMVVKAIFEGIERQIGKILSNDEYNSVEKLIHLTCAFPDTKDVDYHQAMLLKDAFPKPYDKFMHYIEDNWKMSKELFDQCIKEGLIRECDHDVFRIVILGVTKQVLSMENVDQEELLEKSVRLVFDGLVIK
jgi:AcrR family transcriptional regulator